MDREKEKQKDGYEKDGYLDSKVYKQLERMDTRK